MAIRVTKATARCSFKTNLLTQEKDNTKMTPHSSLSYCTCTMCPTSDTPYRHHLQYATPNHPLIELEHIYAISYLHLSINSYVKVYFRSHPLKGNTISAPSPYNHWIARSYISSLLAIIYSFSNNYTMPSPSQNCTSSTP